MEETQREKETPAGLHSCSPGESVGHPVAVCCPCSTVNQVPLCHTQPNGRRVRGGLRDDARTRLLF